MNEFKKHRFGDLYLLPSRNGVSKPSRVRGEGFPMVNMGEIFKYGRIHSILMELVPLTASELLNTELKYKDLLFARQSLVLSGAGKCSIFLEKDKITTFESHLIRVRLDETVANPFFYYYYFSCSLGKALMSSIVMQVAAAGVRGSDIANLLVPFPSVLVQNQIVNILSTYDDLIENNERRIHILETIVRKLYTEWFVNFKFPGHEKIKMMDSGNLDFGMVPEGWEVKNILDVNYFRLINENVSKYNGEKRYFATADVSGISIISNGINYLYKDKPSRAQKIPILNSIWFARMKNTYKVLFFTEQNVDYINNFILSSGFVGFEALEDSFSYLFCLINNKDFENKKDKLSSGSTQVSITNDGLSQMKVLIPKKDILILFEEQVRNLINLIIELQKQNQNLKKSRDLLIPQLASGRLLINDNI